MAIIDQTRTYKDVEDKLSVTTNRRHRKMLRRLLQHCRGEVDEDLEAVLGTLAPNPSYKIWSMPGPATNPTGAEAVRRFYVEEIFAKGRHVLESNKERILVSNDAIVTEGVCRTVNWGQDLKDAGMTVDDPDGCYLLTYRMLIIWPFDANGYIIGEESWSSRGADYIRKIDESEAPDAFKRYVAARRSTLAAA